MKRNIWIAAVSLCLLVAASRGALARENWVPEPGIWTVSKELSFTSPYPDDDSFVLSTRVTNGRELIIAYSTAEKTEKRRRVYTR